MPEKECPAELTGNLLPASLAYYYRISLMTALKSERATAQVSVFTRTVVTLKHEHASFNQTALKK